jgi:hypothetical protein
MASKPTPFAEFKALYQHARPYVKKTIVRYARGISCILAVVAIADLLNINHWVVWLLLFFPFAYLIHAFLIYIAGEIQWSVNKETMRLEKQLLGQDLSERFSALRIRLHASDAKELKELHKVIEFGAREASRMAEEIRAYEGILAVSRDREEEYRKSVEAFASLLGSQADRLAELIERKGRRNQWLLLVAGAVLGVAIQALAQWLF